MYTYRHANSRLLQVIQKSHACKCTICENWKNVHLQACRFQIIVKVLRCIVQSQIKQYNSRKDSQDQFHAQYVQLCFQNEIFGNEGNTEVCFIYQDDRNKLSSKNSNLRQTDTSRSGEFFKVCYMQVNRTRKKIAICTNQNPTIFEALLYVNYMIFIFHSCMKCYNIQQYCRVQS